MKIEKIVLEDLRHINLNDTAFKVKKMTNTIRFQIGDYVSKDEVRGLLKKNNITVEIVSKK
jgi:hypothetical protein